jgi:photosystem II stability/assembly factor-like uncharacterized protein
MSRGDRGRRRWRSHAAVLLAVIGVSLLGVGVTAGGSPRAVAPAIPPHRPAPSIGARPASPRAMDRAGPSASASASASDVRARVGLGSNRVNGIACMSTTRCVAVGDGDEAASVARTTDAGRAWVSEALPFGVTQLQAVSCPSVTLCVGVGVWRNNGAAVVRSRDGGVRWTAASPLPWTLVYLSDLSCPGVSQCLAVGRTYAGVAAIVRSRDGGRSWVM